MSYLDWLWWYRLDDTKDNFKKYLVDFTDWTTDEIEDYVKTFGGYENEY